MSIHKIEVLTVRYNGEVKIVEGINDCYTNVQIFIPHNWNLDQETVDALKTDRWVQETLDGWHLGESEAKDFNNSYGNITIQIEEVEINLK